MLKRSTFLAGLIGAVVFSSSLIAGDTAPADREKLIAHLKMTEAAFLKSIDGVSDAQWKWKSAPDRWSVAETAEHITKAEDMLRGRVEAMLKAPAAAPDMVAKTKGKDEIILKAIPDRTQKRQAPEPLVPKGSFATKAALIEAFKAARAKTLAIASSKTDLRAYANAELPVGETDALQGILFLSAHTERHTKQIEEVKATAGYPAK
jgi:DinB family protein